MAGDTVPRPTRSGTGLLGGGPVLKSIGSERVSCEQRRVMPDQKALRLRFFTWEKPLLGQAVDYLAGDWAEVASDARALAQNLGICFETIEIAAPAEQAAQ